MRRNKSIARCFVFAVMMALVSVSWAQEAEKININKASAVALTQLNRIGPKLSERIVEYREKMVLLNGLRISCRFEASVLRHLI